MFEPPEPPVLTEQLSLTLQDLGQARGVQCSHPKLSYHAI